MHPPFKLAFEAVKSLAEEFEANNVHFLSPQYQESEVRKDFIDKFLTALGWDVNHDLQKNPYEQEVKVERGVIHKGAQRRADYAFYLAPNFRDVRFFAEAKKPFGEMASAQYYFQTIRYGWNAQTPIALLTSFDRFHILDCRYKPDIDSSLSKCLRQFDYKDYLNEDSFAFIYYLFSREAVSGGSLEKFAASLPKNRGKEIQHLVKGARQGIDEAFLEELDEYREKLAKAFKHANPRLDGDTLTEITQRTIDRLVFIRFLEDKLIHAENIVSKFGMKHSAWQDFVAASRRLDGIYNGIVFKRHEVLDDPDFTIDDVTFGQICRKLAHPNTPYDFNSFPIHILGSIYERFLGKIIVTHKSGVNVEEKEEVRKAGGIFYTPEYIVRYIVSNAIGHFIESKSPEKVAAMRFADIACGSGSFLIEVYDLLLRHHTKWYNEHPNKAKKAGCVIKEDGAWHLSLAQRRNILLNNIWGVDIDRQAVEVAQLSLYLKLLQEETTASARQHQLEFQETLLPALNKNILCGNSLITPDILQAHQFPPNEEKKINPMDFAQRFPKIIENGGFDVIVGNPPWGANLSQPELEYLRGRNREIIVRMVDSFMYFIHQSSQLVREGGMFGMILPDVLLYQIDNKKLRELLLDNVSIHQILNMGNVFEGVTRPACILIFKKARCEKNMVKVANYTNLSKDEKVTAIGNETRFSTIFQKEFKKIPSCLFLTSRLMDYRILHKIQKRKCMALKELIDADGIQRGVSPDYKEAFLVDSTTAKKWSLESKLLKPALSGGRQIKRFHIDYPDLQVIYTSRETNFSNIPNICRYIDSFRSKITCKEVLSGKHPLYALHRPRAEHIFTKERKIVGVITEDEIIVALDEGRTFATDGVYLFGAKEGVNENFLLGLLNSRLFVFIYRLLSIEEGRALAQVKPTILADIPIPAEGLKKSGPSSTHDQIVHLVEQVSKVRTQMTNARTDGDKDYFGNKYFGLLGQIDEAVFDFYQLTAREKEIVRQSSDDQ